MTSGYAGGDNDTATYEEVSSGNTDHAEVVRVEYDPAEIKYETLLDVFFTSHDPTTLNKQGNDVGRQYRSVIFYSGQDQKIAAEEYIEKLNHDKVFGLPIVTEVKSAGKFYSAEGDHQNFYDQNREYPYCKFIINPKIAKIREKYSSLLKEEEK